MTPVTPTLGQTARHLFTVTHADTAVALGSGSLEVLATPRLLAWCERVTCQVVTEVLAAGSTSVGTRVSLEHLAASPVGAEVAVSATLTYVDGRLLRFDVVAEHPGGSLVGTGEVTRVIVDEERFLARLG